MCDTVLVYAEFQPNPNYLDTLRDALLPLVDLARAEPGCLRYDVYAIPELKRMALIGEWTDQAAYALHHASHGIPDIFAQYDEWLVQPPHVVRLQNPTPPPPLPEG